MEQKPHDDSVMEVPIFEVEMGPLQVRAGGLDSGHVAALAEVVDQLPPVTAVRVDGRLVLADGHHTVAARQEAGLTDIRVVVVDPPDDGDLVSLAFERNSRHGLPLTLKDRRSYAAYLLERDPSSSNLEVSRRSGLSPSTVAALREQLENSTGLPAADRVVHRGDSTYMYPAVPRQLGDLPDESLGATLADVIAAPFSTAERRAQRRLARYLDRLMVALADRSGLDAWTDADNVAAACVAVHGEEWAAELGARLATAAADLLAAADALIAAGSTQ
jgi:hypothetical protein